MAKGIVINFLSDVRDFLRGTDNVEEALEDVSDSLEDISKDGDKAAEKLADSFKDNLKEVSRAARVAGDGIGDDIKKGTKKAEEGLEEFRDEANSTAKESAASFDGSAESIIDSFQEIAANAFAGFGPAGAVAGLALAAGIGIATAEFTKSEEAAAQAKQRIADMGTAMIDAGAEGEVPLDSIIENLKGIVTNSDDAVKQFKDIQEEAKNAGVDAGALATAYAGGTEALENQVDAINDAIDAQREKLASTEETGAGEVAAAADYLTKLEDQRAALIKVQEEQRAAAEAEQQWLASGGNELIAKAEMVNAVNTAYDDLASSTTDFINAETGLFDTTAYVTAMQERETALADYQNSLTTSGLSPEAQQFLNEQGVEAASKMLEGYKASSPETKKELDRIWKEASKNASGSVKTELDGVIDKKRTANIEAKVNTTVAEQDLNNLIKARQAIIKVDFQDRNGKRVY